MNFALPADHRLKLKESKKREQSLDLGTELKKKNKKNMEHEGDSDTVAGALSTFTKGLVK